ncbi:MAG: hypothetical protein A2171_02305 [Candidatus Levybacteria bacterium RBG_13_35_9]|nr:MAG: hypothetical protein A2171_02305 [Candidatus Levybacteria bacterium RBG_13_35_9]
MAEAELNFAKIVANPTSLGWCQVYSAGKLFAAISLEKQEEEGEKDYLNVVGKEILNTLEQEFFILEKKDLDSIREAVLTTSKKIPEDITISFVAGSIVNNILYVYIIGNGRVDIKREGKLGTILQAKDQKNDSLDQASGYLQDKDIIILQTEAFSNVISEGSLSEVLDNSSISEATENLAPLVHEKENALASSIMVEYKETVHEAFYESPQEKTQEESKPSEKVEEKEESPYFDNQESQEKNLSFKPNLNFSFLKNLSFLRNTGLSHTRKLILTIVVIIIIVFASSIFFALQKQQNDKLKSEFNRIFPEASKKYEEGKSLSDLNQDLAKDSFLSAQKILEEGKGKFPKDSDYSKQIASLLAKINEELGSAPKVTTSSAKEVSASESDYLSLQIKQNALYFTLDEKNVYLITSKEISSIAKGGSSSKTLFENDSDWEDVGGLATYNTNLYVLEKGRNQILKFINSGSQYSKSDYLTAGEKPDFSKAVSIAIDNNIYVLFRNGEVSKYFKGNSQDFSLKGLDKPLSSPTKIYANPDYDNIYILDNGNSRILVFDKTGGFKAQYQADVIKNAKDFEVLEKDKKIFILSSGKIYQIDIK